MSVNHLADQIEDHLGDGSRLGCTVRYLREKPGLPLGTAGSLACCAQSSPTSTYPSLVINGDLMVQFDPAQLLAFHERSGAAVTVATRTYQHEVPFGVVEHGPDRDVVAISEKPTCLEDINAGVYVVSPAGARPGARRHRDHHAGADPGVPGPGEPRRPHGRSRPTGSTSGPRPISRGRRESDERRCRLARGTPSW